MSRAAPGGAPRRPSRRLPGPGDWGVQVEFEDGRGRRRRASPAAVAAIVDAMAAGSSGRPKTARPVFARPGETAPAGAREVFVEGGGRARLDRGRLPLDLPFGYHRLVMDDSRELALVTSPGRCHLPEALRGWGWAVQLYALRSRRSWGIGDLGDLRGLARWSAGLGADFVLLNPLHAPLPLVSQQPSPYYPSSRRFRNPLLLRVEDVPGARDLGAVAALATVGRKLNDSDRVERDRVFRLKMEALGQVWKRFARMAPPSDARAFERFRREQGESLHQYGVFCTLAERFNGGWRRWPDEFRRPGGQAVSRFADYRRDRVDFHRWLQWLLDRQLKSAAGQLDLVHDLAVGFDPDGADAWSWQEVIAGGVRVGAPPDAFNTLGQDWGFPPFDPHRLAAAGYQPIIETLRAAMRHGAGLRIDHVMALFRLWWIPPGHGPADGGYVRYRAEDLLDILALESLRAGVFVIGEDLGTVERGVRQELARRRLLSSRVLWFEKQPPARYPPQTMATVTTHDLPTVAGLWSGADLEAQQSLGLEPNHEAQTKIRRRLARLLDLAADAPIEEIVAGVYARLALAPSRLIAASLDDACAAARRPNMPGTVDKWPNWSIPLPMRLEQLVRDPLPRRIAGSLRRPGVAAADSEQADG